MSTKQAAASSGPNESDPMAAGAWLIVQLQDDIDVLRQRAISAEFDRDQLNKAALDLVDLYDQGAGLEVECQPADCGEVHCPGDDTCQCPAIVAFNTLASLVKR